MTSTLTTISGVTPEEKELIKKAARIEKRTISSLMRYGSTKYAEEVLGGQK